MPSLQQLILASNPVGYYTLSDIDNLGHDSSPYANNGSQSGSFSTVHKDLWGNSLTLTKGLSSPLVVIPDRAEYRGSTLTLEFVIADWEDDNKVIAERGGDNKNWALQSAGTSFNMTPRGLQFIVGDQSINPRNGALGSLGSLCHVIATATAGKTRFYINGILYLDSVSATGNGTQANQQSLPIHLFSRGGLYQTSAALGHLAIYNRVLTPTEIESRRAWVESNITIKGVSSCVSWVNPETREQAWPGEIAAKPVPKQVPALLWRATEPVQQIDAKLSLGFIRGVTSLQGVPQVNKRVVCFDESMLPVAECNTDASGEFRFDLLWKHRLYTIMAMDSGSFTYSPAAADRRQPESYA